MKLFFLDQTSRTAINVRRLKNCGFKISGIIASDAKHDRRALIVLGDSSPEDKVFGVIAYHLDGNGVVGIAKPSQTHLAALDQLKTYIELNVQKIMIVIDQDNWALEDLFREAERRIQGIGVNPQPQTTAEDKVMLYQCTLAHRAFELIVVVSGHDEFITIQHTIEDHLLKFAGFDEAENPKEFWRERLDPDEKEDIFRLFQDKDVVELLFPQHSFACEHLK